ncbi:MCE family protein [Jatrophihabitans telluris]|uniref:MCE family protein n=1 Tax=Jatrophihabitans telluris TaxID=2038343 RepID=A0ABY4QXC9_9ACTN|nr:MlaD family protein [Jatrophihabitans telluris]UQX88019.1 MCE family protein [Jatrophihabitans telluris]
MRGLLSPLLKLVAFLVVTSLATYVLAATITNASFGKTRSYYALFHDATGLLIGDDVRVAGVRVGTVEGIKLVREPATAGAANAGSTSTPAAGAFVARVRFSVADNRPLTTWSLAKLRFRNLVGQRYVDVEEGSPIDGVAQQTLPDKGTIPLSQTTDALDLSTLFAGFKPLFAGLDPAEMNSLSLQIIQTLQGEGGTVDALLQQTAALTSAIADKDKVIGDLVDNLSSVLDTLGQRDQKLSDLISELQRWVSGLAGDRKTIGDSIAGVNTLAQSTTGLLSQIRPSLKQDVVDLNGLASTLNAGGTELDGVLQRLPNKVASLTRTATYGSWFNFYLCSMSGTVTLPGNVKLDPSIASGTTRCN